jgi:hypothetical protein
MADEAARVLRIRNLGLAEQQTQTSFSFPAAGLSCQACGLRAGAELLELRRSHSLCLFCLRRISRAQFDHGAASIFCSLCLCSLSDAEISRLDPSLVRELDARAFGGGDVRRCPRCQTGFIIEAGAVAHIFQDEKGRRIEGAALESLRLHRFKCPIEKCRVTFCSACLRVPFHEGWTCSDQALIENGIVCRFCGHPLPGAEGLNAGELVCAKPDCQDLFARSCSFFCQCGHP